MQIFMNIYILLIGMCIGSFLNVLIYRIPLQISVVKGHSFCPSCNHPLGWLDLFPVFSYMLLGGRCRYCKTRISFRYPFVEILTAVCYLAVYRLYGLSLSSLCYMVVCTCLIVLAFIDIDHKIIPNRFPVLIGLCGVMLFFISAELHWYDRLIGLFVMSLPLFLIALITGGMGEGDVKLFAAIGLVLGWKLTLLTMLFASVIAAAVGLTMITIKKADGKTELPFGPYIAISAMLSLFAGNSLMEAYLSFLR